MIVIVLVFVLSRWNRLMRKIKRKMIVGQRTSFMHRDRSPCDPPPTPFASLKKSGYTKFSTSRVAKYTITRKTSAGNNKISAPTNGRSADNPDWHRVAKRNVVQFTLMRKRRNVHAEMKSFRGCAASLLILNKVMNEES